MSTRKIPNSDIESNSVEHSLANRPSSVSRYGEGSLTPTQVKAAYDKLPRLIASYFNAFVEAVENGTIFEDIPSGISDQLSLADLISGISDGTLSKLLCFADGTTLDAFKHGITSDRYTNGSITLDGEALSGLSYTVTIEGLGANDTIMFSPASKADADVASECGLFVSAEEEGTSVTFTVDEIPSDTISLNYVILRG